MKVIKKLFFLLDKREQNFAGLLLLMMITMALLETIGVASILPFMAVLTNPEIIQTNVILNNVYQKLNQYGIEDQYQFTLFLGISVFILLLTSIAFKALTSYAEIQFAQMREYTIGKRLFEGYLYQQYSWFLNRNSADLGKNILSEVDQVISKGITPLLTLLAKGMVALAIIILLIIADPIMALIVAIIVFFFYGILISNVKTYLNKIGEKRLKNNKFRFIAINEAFGAIKEIKLKKLEKVHIANFSNSARNLAKVQTISQVVAQLPRYILETIAFGGILLILLVLMIQKGSFINALPVLSLYVFAGYRLIPPLQQIYVSFTQLTFVGSSIEKLFEELKYLKKYEETLYKNKISFNSSIELKNISYTYPNSSRATLNDINIFIPARSTIGLVGATGSGKTTTADIILGLLQPLKGDLKVDGKIINKDNLESWQELIGYVPQNIYLSDDTIAANIAFGENSKNINHGAVVNASQVANLHDFIINDLPEQYQTTVGERGVRLSGGQRQRIGIARALYHEPKILILDEATSALDVQTEKAVMDAINKLNKTITIIIIAHRLSTLVNSDKIFLFENGVIKKEGTFKQVIASDEKFYINS